MTLTIVYCHALMTHQQERQLIPYCYPNDRFADFAVANYMKRKMLLKDLLEFRNYLYYFLV